MTIKEKFWPTTMAVQMNKMYVKKSPGCENFGDAFSSLLP